MAAESAPWGTQLADPSELSSFAVITAMQDAFAASQAHAAGCASAQEAQQARIRANFTPPEGYVFAHRLTAYDYIQITTLQENEGRRRALHRDFMHIGGLGVEGSILFGDRIYFDFNLTDRPLEATMAIMSIVDYSGAQGPHRLALPIHNTLELIEGIQVILRNPIEAPVADTAVIEAASLARLGIARRPSKPVRLNGETEAPRGRSKE